mgnify:CR=1 FL=1
MFLGGEVEPFLSIHIRKIRCFRLRKESFFLEGEKGLVCPAVFYLKIRGFRQKNKDFKLTEKIRIFLELVLTIHTEDKDF